MSSSDTTSENGLTRAHTTATVDDGDGWASILTPTFLTTALRTGGVITKAQVTNARFAPVGRGQMAQSVRVSLSYDLFESDAPASVIAKLPSTDSSSLQMASATSAYVREVRFYQELASGLDVRCPRVYFASLSDHTSFVLLLEDLGPATVPDQLLGCTPDQAALAMEQAAALHASSWHDPRLLTTKWLPGVAIWRQLGGTLTERHQAFLERFGSALDPEHVTIIERLAREVGLWLSTLEEPRCLWHGDFRLDNILLDAKSGDVPIAIVDWQSVMPGPGVIDTSFFLGTSLTEADRAANERALLLCYHQALSSRGVDGYSWEQCWREYQMHALFALVITIPASLGVQHNERGDEMFLTMARRAASQIAAHDSFSVLQSHAR